MNTYSLSGKAGMNGEVLITISFPWGRFLTAISVTSSRPYTAERMVKGDAVGEDEVVRDGEAVGLDVGNVEEVDVRLP